MTVASEAFQSRGNADGQSAGERCPVGTDCAAAPAGAAQARGRSAQGAGPSRPHGHPLRTAFGPSLGDAAPGDGMWLRDDLLAPTRGVAGGWGMGPAASAAPREAPRGRADRLVPGCPGLQFSARSFGGAHTGPNPTDRARKGSKHHVISDGQGTPLAVRLTAANVNDVTQLQVLVEAIPPLRGKRGRPRRRPEIVQADRGYDSQEHRVWLRQHGIRPLLAKRGTPHGSGLGTTRWVIERTMAWLHHFRRLRIRWERRADIHSAFLVLGAALITYNVLQRRLC